MTDQASDARERRRTRVEVPATLQMPCGRTAGGGEIQDLSEQGCRIDLDHDADPVIADQDVVVRPDGIEALAGKVRWTHEKSAGVEFASRLHPAVVDHAAGDERLEGCPPPRRPLNADFTDNFGRPLPALGSSRRR